MGISKVDEKRRIVLPKEIVEEYGDRFVVIRVGDDIMLKPLPKDPLKALMEEGRKFRGVTAKQIRKDFERKLKERSAKRRP